jgi:hypothetical protein
MRFSLKWILAGMAYVAIAAAAFGRGNWYYADLLWAVTLLAVVYGILVTAFARGRRQVAAAGFVVASVCFVLCVAFGSDAVPIERLLIASGVGKSGVPVATQTVVQTVNVAVPVPSSPYPPSWPSPSAVPSQPAARYSYTPAPMAAPAMPTPTAPVAPVDFASYVRAANAVATLAFGLMGSLVGLMAFRASGHQHD